MIPFLRKCSSVVFIAASVLSAQSAAPGETSLLEDPLLNWLNGIAQQELHQRAESIRGIHSKEAAEARKQFVRKELLEDIGGLPNYDGPLHARITGEIKTSSYIREKVL